MLQESRQQRRPFMARGFSLTNLHQSQKAFFLEPAAQTRPQKPARLYARLGSICASRVSRVSRVPGSRSIGRSASCTSQGFFAPSFLAVNCLPWLSNLLWMVAKSISHHYETTGNPCSLVVTGESSVQSFLGGAGFRPSTVGYMTNPNMGCPGK